MNNKEGKRTERTFGDLDAEKEEGKGLGKVFLGSLIEEVKKLP